MVYSNCQCLSAFYLSLTYCSIYYAPKHTGLGLSVSLSVCVCVHALEIVS